jgi:uncharacterized membrane protein
MQYQVFQIILFLAAPALAIWITSRSKIAEALGPVAVCYIIGILYGNLPFAGVDKAISENAGGAAVVLAIPLLLFSVNVAAWWKSAGVTVRASLICFFSAAVAATGAGVVFYGHVPHSNSIAAALAGVYTGGTPSMFAIAKAIQLPAETLIMTNLSDLLIGGPYYLFLVAFGWRVYRWFLPPPVTATGHSNVDEERGPLTFKALLRAFLLAAFIAGISVGVSSPLAPEWRDVVTILLVSTLAIAASFSSRIRTMPGHFELGEYVLLIFGVSIGSMANFSEIVHADPTIFFMVATIFGTTTLLQALLFRIFKIDSDTACVAAIGSTYSPPFVGPVATRMKNKDALFSGITIGLMGYAVATYLGLMVYQLLTWFHAS